MVIQIGSAAAHPSSARIKKSSGKPPARPRIFIRSFWMNIFLWKGRYEAAPPLLKPILPASLAKSKISRLFSIVAAFTLDNEAR